MKKNEYVLGIDTSNYTTSVGIVTRGGDVVANIKRPLPVAPGARGLRQSDALFAHTKNLPSAMEEAAAVLRDGDVAAVGVSTRPRNADGSYMSMHDALQIIYQEVVEYIAKREADGDPESALLEEE